MYPAELTIPMEKDLTEFGFGPLKDSDQVESAIKTKGTSLLIINSVCGCAAGNARPGVKHSLNNDKKPDNLYTVFAGVDREAVDKVREHFLPYPPSSPCIALLKDGQIVHFLERRHIEGNTAQAIAANLQDAYNTHC